MMFLISRGTLKRYEQGILMTVFINIILAVSLNLTTGFLGQLALGHAGFMSVGAYAAAVFSKTVPLADGPLKLVAAMLLGGGGGSPLWSYHRHSGPAPQGGPIWPSSPWALAKSSGWSSKT